MARNILIHVLALAFAASLSNAASTCYYPDGTSSTTQTPCVDTVSGFSACCTGEDECLTNGLCKAAGMLSTTAFWRESCTDSSWQSDACPKYCYNESTSHEASSGNSFVLACSDTTYCCAEQSMALATGNYSYCCGNENALFSAIPAVHLSGPENPLPSFSSTLESVSAPASASTPSSASTSMATSTSAFSISGVSSSTETGGAAAAATGASTAQPSESKSSSLSTGAKAGIGIGVAAGIIIIAALAFLAFRRSRAKKNQHQVSKGDTDHFQPDSRGYETQYHGQEKRELANDGAVAEMDDNEAPMPELPSYVAGGGRMTAELEGA